MDVDKFAPNPESDLEIKRKKVTLRLIILILIILAVVIFLYFDNKMSKLYKTIGGTGIGLLLFGAIYSVFGNTLIGMDSYEKERRALHPSENVPDSIKIRNYILIFVVGAILGAFIIALSYL